MGGLAAAMNTPYRTTITIGFIIALVSLPLLGVVYGLLNPPPALFAMKQQTIWEVISSTGTPRLFLRSVSLGLLVSILALLLGTLLAWLEQRCQYPGRKWLSLGCLMPLAVPSYLAAAVLRHSCSPGGSIGDVFNLPSFTGFFPATVSLVIITTPLVQLVVGAALAKSSASEEEAARCLGARGWRLFKTVWLPRLRPAWAMSLLLVILYAISDFGAVAVLDCPVLSWRLYQAMDLMQTRETAVFGVTLLLTTIPIVIAARYIQGSHRHKTVANPRPAARLPLAKWQSALAISIQIGVIGFGILIPFFTLLGWTISGINNNTEFASLHKPILHSLSIASLGTITVLACSLLPAWTAARARKGSGIIDHSVYMTGALPGILLGGGLLLAALGLSRQFPDSGMYAWLQGSGILLMLGYAIRFIPESFAPLKTALLHIDPRHDEAARTLGSSFGKRLRHIHIPAMTPGIAAASVLVFVAILKELPITLLLGGAMGLTPLSYRVWERYEEAFLPDAGLAGLVLLSLALAAALLTLRFRRHV